MWPFSISTCMPLSQIITHYVSMFMNVHLCVSFSKRLLPINCIEVPSENISITVSDWVLIIEMMPAVHIFHGSCVKKNDFQDMFSDAWYDKCAN